MRFTKPYKTHEHICPECGAEHKTETLSEVEERQGADFLNDENLKCFDCLEIELFGETEKA